MKTTLNAALAALVLTAAAPAFAGDQLAASLGVEPGAYTLAQLSALEAAEHDGNRFVANQIRKSAAAGFEVSSMNGASDGSVQLARSLGVEPGSLSLAELSALSAARNDNNRATARHIEEGAVSGLTLSTSNERSTSGADQLSRSLGVEPGTLTLAQLSALASAQNDGDHTAARAILKAGAAQ